MSAVAKKRYAQVGLGQRANCFYEPIIGPHAHCSELVGFCDVNQGRMDYNNGLLVKLGYHAVPTFRAEQFDQMVAQTRPDTVIITTPDCWHDHYACRAMELGCDVLCEKPMTIDEQKCRRILETIHRTGRRMQVTFNYRYSPVRTQVREILASGAIGTVLSVDFAWLLDTRHGTDYFRRWHRQRKNSGSLLVHKATHHFDLVNWWLADRPEEVFCHATRRYFTPEHADELGITGRGERCRTCPAGPKCLFYTDMAKSPMWKARYLDHEHHDGYFLDRCVFGPEIDIWDNMSVSVRYRGGALLNYMLVAFAPWEGYRVAFNGTKGRLEHDICERTYPHEDRRRADTTPRANTAPPELTKREAITIIPEFSQPRSIPVRKGEGGHGGGDPLLMADMFEPDPPPDPLGRKADHRDGAYSILIGVAAAKSVDTHLPVKIADLLGDAPM